MSLSAKRWGMVVDASRCVGCFNCHLACRDEHSGTDHLPLSRAQPARGASWIEVRLKESGTFPKVKLSRVPVPCLQCDDAPCLRAATGGAVYRRDDGIVVIDPVKAVDQPQIGEACPYGVIAWNADLQLAQKCTFCAHLLDAGWKEPRCVEACPTQALRFGDIADPESEVSQLRAKRELAMLPPTDADLPPAASAGVLFSGLPGRCLAGELAFGDRPEEPACGITVRLRSEGHERTLISDAYGDFEFGPLSEDAAHLLRVEHPGYATREIPVGKGGAINLGAIVLLPQS